VRGRLSRDAGYVTRAAADFARRHEYLAAGLFLMVVLCVYFWPLFIGHQLGQSHVLYSSFPWLAERPPGLAMQPGSGEGDAALEYQPTLAIAREQIHDGRLPLWNPYSYGGMTLQGNFQTALLYPLTWLALVLPIAVAWGPIGLLKLLTAGLGAYALARHLTLRPAAALIAALIYMLCAPNVVWLQWPLATVFSVFPWVLLATDRLYRRQSRGGVGLLGLAVGLSILAGHPESAFLSSSAAAVYLLALMLADRRTEIRASMAAFGRFALGNLIGASLSAATLVPFLTAYSYSISVEAHGEVADSSIPLWGAIVYFLPNVFGAGQPDYYGPPFSYLSVAAYFGVAAILLAGVALVRLRAEPRTIALAVMALVAAMTAFRLPPVSWILSAVPPYSTGNLGRVFFVVALAAALGAGAGFDSLSRRSLPFRRVGLWAGGMACFVVAFLALLAVTNHLPAPRSVEHRALALFVVMLALATACLVAIGRLRPRRALILTLAVVALDLAYLQDHNALLPPEAAYPSATPAVEALTREPGPFRMTSFRTSIEQPLVLPPNTSALYGLEDVQGYDYPQPRRWADLSWYVLRFRGITRELNFLTPRPPAGPVLSGLRMVNTRYYLAPPDTDPPDPSFKTVYQGSDGTVFRDPEALPRAYVVSETRPLDEAATRATLERGALDARREALVSPAAPHLPAATGGFSEAAVEVLSEDHVRVHLPAGPSAGWLVLANSYSPEWRVEIDGQEAEIFPTNLAVMGLPVSDGARTVDFRLSHRSFWLGTTISATALVLLAALLLTGRRRRRGLRWERGPAGS